MTMIDIQELILKLSCFWRDYGCTLAVTHTSELGAGTLHPCTFFSAVSNQKTMVAYLQPSVRPIDGRYGMHPNRLYQHHQYQVLINPCKIDLQDVYMASLDKIGIDTNLHDVNFLEDDWNNLCIGAAGLGWEVSLDGCEITQFTYIQQIAGIDCESIPCEITYGIERIAMSIQETDNVFSLLWNKNENVTYGDIYKLREYEFSKFAFQESDPNALFNQFCSSKESFHELIFKNMPVIAYEECIKASHIFNLLDARGHISYKNRVQYVGEIRNMAKACGELYNRLIHNNAT